MRRTVLSRLCMQDAGCGLRLKDPQGAPQRISVIELEPPSLDDRGYTQQVWAKVTLASGWNPTHRLDLASTAWALVPTQRTAQQRRGSVAADVIAAAQSARDAVVARSKEHGADTATPRAATFEHMQVPEAEPARSGRTAAGSPTKHKRDHDERANQGRSPKSARAGASSAQTRAHWQPEDLQREPAQGAQGRNTADRAEQRQGDIGAQELCHDAPSDSELPSDRNTSAGTQRESGPEAMSKCAWCSRVKTATDSDLCKSCQRLSDGVAAAVRGEGGRVYRRKVVGDAVRASSVRFWVDGHEPAMSLQQIHKQLLGPSWLSPDGPFGLAAGKAAPGHGTAQTRAGDDAAVAGREAAQQRKRDGNDEGSDDGDEDSDFEAGGAARAKAHGSAGDAPPSEAAAEPLVGTCKACGRDNRLLGDNKSGFRCKGDCLSAYRKLKQLLAGKQPLGQKYGGDNARRPGDKLNQTIRIRLEKEPGFFESAAWKAGKPRAKLEALLEEDVDSFMARCPPKRS